MYRSKILSTLLRSVFRGGQDSQMTDRQENEKDDVWTRYRKMRTKEEDGEEN